MHISSLPSRFGIGDLGPGAFAFADFLVEAGQKLWQVLPVGPTGYGDSPYQCFSAFAGNPLFIDLEALREQGLIQVQSLEAAPVFSDDSVEYNRVIDFKYAMLREAASYRLLVELRPVPPVQPPLATVRRAFAAVLHRAANAIAVEA